MSVFSNSKFTWSAAVEKFVDDLMYEYEKLNKKLLNSKVCVLASVWNSIFVGTDSFIYYLFVIIIWFHGYMLFYVATSYWRSWFINFSLPIVWKLSQGKVLACTRSMLFKFLLLYISYKYFFNSKERRKEWLNN